ncbi:MAG: hypothetical protein ICV73_12295, partial [Acetobacteraceae bacterium]|nr:hypothetical protein [Acetobacteraceae bacterium]
DPQGFNFGRLLQGAQQAMQAAQQAAHVVNAARQFLPMAAGPQQAAGAGAEFDPQGFNFGSLLNNSFLPRPPVLTTLPTRPAFGLPF